MYLVTGDAYLQQQQSATITGMIQPQSHLPVLAPHPLPQPPQQSKRIMSHKQLKPPLEHSL